MAPDGAHLRPNQRAAEHELHEPPGRVFPVGRGNETEQEPDADPGEEQGTPGRSTYSFVFSTERGQSGPSALATFGHNARPRARPKRPTPRPCPRVSLTFAVKMGLRISTQAQDHRSQVRDWKAQSVLVYPSPLKRRRGG
jgi:hypothetical protein